LNGHYQPVANVSYQEDEFHRKHNAEQAMSPFQKSLISLVLLIACVIGVPLLMMAKDQNSGWVVLPALLGAVVYAGWFFTFSCPKCGEPLLWTPSKSGVRGRLLPRSQCLKCGLSSHEAFGKMK
jgi:predicted RNA-binding Zn-ribbon protein involved in translation (DUF1610 family)